MEALAQHHLQAPPLSSLKGDLDLGAGSLHQHRRPAAGSLEARPRSEPGVDEESQHQERVEGESEPHRTRADQTQYG